MKFYEAMSEIKGTRKMFVEIVNSTHAYVYKFNNNGNGMLRADLWYAMVDKYWLPVYFGSGSWFDIDVCQKDYIILNSFEDLYKLCKDRNGKLEDILNRLKLARKYKVIDREQEKKILEDLA